MHHSPAKIILYAADAGFPRATQPCLAAIALATSGGYDHYDHRVGLPGAGRFQGLWGVDTDRYPELVDNIHDPRICARAALALTSLHHGLTWAGAFNTGLWLTQRDRCIAAMAEHPYDEHQHSPTAQAVHDRHGTFTRHLRSA